MAALNFPGSPSNGDEFEGYIYDATLGVWNRKPNTVAYTVSANAPTNPNDGDVWFNETDGSSYIYYVDADSEQWVEIGGTVGATGARGENGSDGRFTNSATKPEEAVDGDVWFNTNTGQIFVYYNDGTTSQWVESGTKVLAYETLANLSDTDIPSPSDGQALIYNSSTSKWEPGSAAPSGVNTIVSDNINIDFSDNVPLETRTVTGDVIFTASNYTAGAKKTVYLEGDTVQRSLTFPTEWNFITDKPTAIGADKKNILDLNSFGTSESTTVALWLGTSAFEPTVATGGSETEIVVSGITYKLHTFAASGSSLFVVTDQGSLREIEYLIVGGGGGGASFGGGGGGGGLLTNQGSPIQIGEISYPIVVGSGGAGAPADNSSSGADGSDSSAFNYVAVGGGGGGGADSAGRPGGSGGGGGQSNRVGGLATVGQGFDGGTGNNNGGYNRGAGGGGAGQIGQPPVIISKCGNGGNGLGSNITGTTITYAGGGGGGGVRNAYASQIDGGDGGLGGGGDGGTSGTSNSSQQPGQNGTNTLGGGGGSAAYINSPANNPGGNGGSGIVIVRYPITDPN